MSNELEDGHYNGNWFRTSAVVQPGWTIKFALWVRRWILTIGASLVVVAMRFDWFWLAVWVLAVAFDIWITPRAIDLRLTDDQILHAISEKRRFRDLVDPDRRDKLVVGILIALCISAILCGLARIPLDVDRRDMSVLWRFARGASIGITLTFAASLSWFGFELLTARRCPVLMAFGGGALDSIARILRPLQCLLLYLGGLLMMLPLEFWPIPRGLLAMLLVQALIFAALCQISLLSRSRIRAV